MMHDVTGAVDPDDDLELLAERVDRTVEALDTLEAAARERAAAARRAVEAFHRAGLTTIVKRLKADPRGRQLLFELVDDPGVRALLSMHGIIRTPPTGQPEPPPDLVQIRLPGDWHPGPRTDDVPADRTVAFDAAGSRVLVLRARGMLRAFRNACGHVGLPLDRGDVDEDAAVLTCPWHGNRFDTDSGACLSAADCPLEPLPLRVTGAIVEVRIG